MKSIELPEEAVEWARHALELLRTGEPVHADLVQTDHGRGGQMEDGRFRFELSTRDGAERWTVTIGATALELLAAGDLTRFPRLERRDDATQGVVVCRAVEGASQSAPATELGLPLLIWGPEPNDCWRVNDVTQLGQALVDLEQRARNSNPRAVWLVHERARMLAGIAPDDWLLAAWFDEPTAYALSAGVEGQTEPIVFRDISGDELLVTYEDCVPARRGRRALLHFVATAALHPDVRWRSRGLGRLAAVSDIVSRYIPSQQPPSFGASW